MNMTMPTIMTMDTTMGEAMLSDTAKLLKLMAWLSPAFPVGGFNFSHGLEAAVSSGSVHDRDSLHAWLCGLIAHGSAHNDAVLFAESWRAAHAGDSAALTNVAELAEALAGSSGRHLETMAQGTAFLAAVMAWPSPMLEMLGGRAALPVAVGVAAGAHDVALESALAGYLQAFVSQQIQAALRLMPLGQSAGVALLSSLEGEIAQEAERAVQSSLDDLGSSAILSEIAAMQHETLEPRIFRS